MGQRLGVAAALLGQPQTVVLDEPVNGLDPDGVRWIRLLLKSLADEGRTVFVSSHLMSEMAQTATQLIVLGRGKLITEASVEDFVDHATGPGCWSAPRKPCGSASCWPHPASPWSTTERTCCASPAPPPSRSAPPPGGRTCPCYELTPTHASLEEAFMQVTQDSIEYHAGATR